MAWIVCSVLLLLIITPPLYQVYSHPQCLDFRPPYSDNQVGYCAEYEDYGCCWRLTDRRVRKRVDLYANVLAKTSNDTLLDQCKPFLRNISCLYCNPYASHLFDVEGDGEGRTFPWLCQDYCEDAYRHCYSVLLQMFKLKHTDFGIRKSPTSPSEVEEDAKNFCGQIIPSESPYCYPQVLNGPQLPDQDPVGNLSCVCGVRVASGLRNPLVATHSGDGSGRLFIVEQIGTIKVLTAQNSLLPEPFLDITDRVLTSGRGGDERGLLGLAFHPNYKTNGKFYVYYSVLVSGNHWSRVSEFRVSNDSDIANVSSEQEIWSVRQPATNHNGGQLLFNEGYLLIFLGDGGGSGDTYRNGLNKETWLGSVLRIDVDNPDPSMGTRYSLPPDNPFIGQTSAKPEIFAYGLRNPWRCSVDRGDPATGQGRGRIFCGDVGQRLFEEVDIIVSGGNYGWRAYEGNHCFARSLCNDDSLGPFTAPIDVYGHSIGVSVTGGYVYRGCLYPNLKGLYIFGDYGSGRLFVLRETEDGWVRSDLCMGDVGTCTDGLVGRNRERYILSFGEDEQGELYILTTSSPSPTSSTGVVYQIVDPSRRASPTLCQ